MNRTRAITSAIILAGVAMTPAAQGPAEGPARTPPAALTEFFAPPEKYRSEFGDFRSPLVFADGTRVQSPADWRRRRQEILSTWHKIMGPWPPLIQSPRVEVVNTTRRESILQQQLRIEIALGGEMVDALLLVRDGEIAVRKRPAVLVVYYDAETGAGLGATADPKGAGPFRKLPTEGQLRTGAYQTLVEGGHDLVELHALMAPRPFLVSGGTADLTRRPADPVRRCGKQNHWNSLDEQRSIV
jgi:hypothetical protein